MIAFARGAWTGLLQDPDAGSGEDRVEGGGELGVPIAKQELDRLGALVEVHEQVPGLLGDPGVVRMGGHAEDPDAAGGVLDDCQDVGGGAVEQVNGEEVGGQHRLSLGVEVLRPRRSTTSGRGWQPSVGENLPHRRGGHADAEAGEFSVDTPVAPARVLPSQPNDQPGDVVVGSWSARSLVLGFCGPASTEDVTPPAQDGLRRDDQSQACVPSPRDELEKRRDQRPVRPRHLWAGRRLALQNRELVTQKQNLSRLPRLIST